jgi:hypothetical protein
MHGIPKVLKLKNTATKVLIAHFKYKKVFNVLEHSLLETVSINE